MNRRPKIFVSYSHRDHQWLEKLKTFLRPLEREAELQVWNDQNIQPSSNWNADIETAINNADAAILLVSQDFLASDYVMSDELPRLLTAASHRGLQIFPVFVSTCFLRRSPLNSFQGVNNPQRPLDSVEPSEQNRVFTKLAESIDDLLMVAWEGITEEWLEKFRSRFKLISGGTFVIGDSDLHNQRESHALPEREVSVQSFLLGRYVITQAEWKALMSTQPWSGQANVRYGDDIPAVYISWHEALDFARALDQADSQFHYRLPTEAEWEYAARGGQAALQQPRSRFSFGDDPNDLISYGWHDTNASSRGESYPHAVGLLRPNQLGLFDMHGNVWEWTADNLAGFRAVRGGGFDFPAVGASSAFRGLYKPEVKSPAIGFRLVQERW